MYELITTGHLDVFKIITFNVISSSSHYDELITNKQLQAREEYEHSIQKRHLKIQEETFHNQKKRKILVVDDEPDICLIYRIVLQDAGFECKSYTDSVKALQEFRPNYYDLILLDIKMPKLDGFELCKNIREVDETVQAAFITASEMYYENVREKYYPELGNINYIQKPIGNEDLIKIVNMILATRDAKKLIYGGSSSQSPPIFILCDTCRWCATYFDKTRIPRGNICPQCRANNNELTSFPIMSNESFTFVYNDKRGVELEFKPRRKGR